MIMNRFEVKEGRVSATRLTQFSLTKLLKQYITI